MVLIEKIGVDALPFIPQLCIGCFRYDRPIFLGLISWVLKHVVEQGVIVEYGDDPIDPESATFNPEWFDYYEPELMDFSSPEFVFVAANDPSLGKNTLISIRS